MQKITHFFKVGADGECNQCDKLIANENNLNQKKKLIKYAMAENLGFY